MKYNNKNFALVLFVLFTTMILGSAIDAYAAEDGDIEACLNRAMLPNFPPCDNAEEWRGGNITNEASYKEGGSIPVRVDITGLETEENVLKIGWDITKTQGNVTKHTFDYITSFNYTTQADPCLGGDPNKVCENWDGSSDNIPPPTENTLDNTNATTTDPLKGQPLTSFDLLDLEDKLFWMFSPPGTTVVIDSVSYITEGEPGDNKINTDSSSLLIEYTTDSPLMSLQLLVRYYRKYL